MGLIKRYTKLTIIIVCAYNIGEKFRIGALFVLYLEFPYHAVVGWDADVEWLVGFECEGAFTIVNQLFSIVLALCESCAPECVLWNGDFDIYILVVEVDHNQEHLFGSVAKVGKLAACIEVAIVDIHQVEKFAFANGFFLVAEIEHLGVGLAKLFFVLCRFFAVAGAVAVPAAN